MFKHKTVIFFGLFQMGLFAQPADLKVVGSTATQAVLSYRSPSAAPCGVEVSESSTFPSVVNDTDGTLFSGANTDTLRSVANPDPTVRTVVIGRRTAEPSGRRMVSRALRTDTTHYARITCEGNAAVIEFRTSPTAGLTPEPPPFHPAAYGNFAVPDFDWADRSKPVIDPQSGVAIYRVADPGDYGANAEFSFPGAAIFGGDGWNNVSNLTSGSTSQLASTSQTNPAFISIDSTAALTWGGWANTSTQGHPVTDMAVRLFGSGNDDSPSNRTVSVCISADSGATCYSDAIDVVLPQGGAQDTGITPSNFPSPLFSGWGKAVTREFFTSEGTVTVSNGLMTLTKDIGGIVIEGNFQTARSRFHLEWSTGSKVFVANSAPTCPNNYCTIASVSTRLQLTLQENLTLAETSYKFAGLGFRIVKNTASGTVNVSAKYRIAKSFLLTFGAGGGCGVTPVQTSVDRSGNPLGRSITGFLCILPLMYEAAGRLYFIGASEPEFRLLSLIRQPAAIAGHAAADLPNAVGDAAGPTVPSFDPSDPNILYTGIRTAGGSYGVFKVTYSGDYRENAAAFWNSSMDTTPALGDDNLSWENLTKSSEGKDIRSLILANLPYNEAQWGSLNGPNLYFDGIVDKYALFHSQPVGGAESACWLFTFDAQQATLARGWNTLNGGGEGSLGGGCHATVITANRVMVANNGLRNANPASQWGGPFDVPVSTVKKNGTFSFDTSLPPAPDGSYDAACPADLPAKWKDLGATGNECVTVRLASEPCSSFATNNERIFTPCPSNPAKSWVGVPVAEGQGFFVAAEHPDNEHFTVVRRTDLPGGMIELILLRDSTSGYCCQVYRSRGRTCLAGPNQATHASGMSFRLSPNGSCYSVLQAYDPATGTYIPEEPNIIRGHFSFQLLSSGNHTFAGIDASGYVSRYDVPATEFGKRQTANFAQWPKFAGVPSDGSGFLQSYIAVGGAAAAPSERRFASDWRHPNGNIGLAAEGFGQTIGSAYTLTLQPGTSSVYRVSTITGTYDPKRTPLIVWAGKYVMSEKSSPLLGDTLTDVDSARFCYAYKAGECRGGSPAGALYVSFPGLEANLTYCQASQISFRSLCAFAGNSVFGQIMQLQIDKSDAAGLNQRRLGYGLTRPGSQYVYTKAKPFSDGKAILATAWNLQGVMSVPTYMKLPSLPSEQNRTTFIPVTVSGSGAGYVEFGYEEYGARDQFFCTPRAEACRVSADKINEANPFSYASESLAAAGGSITIPALPGRVVYYRTVTNGVAGAIQAVPIP
ncbi:MAG: hypothetical protein HYZ37_10635 [Candidatus Solibacter usitatus]|nr:hypothetical protein [Candidatus Solibacter usitatus]